jgi:hypothetical protein
MTFHEVQHRLDTLLRDAGCERYSARQALADAAGCWREIRQDDIAHGGSGDEPFFNFVVAEGVGIFSFYSTNVDFYVVRADDLASRVDSEPLLTTEAEWIFRDRFEPLAMTEVDEARAILASQFNHRVPALSVEPPLSHAWLLSSAGDSAAG